MTDAMAQRVDTTPPRWFARAAAVLGLLLLAPFCGELLSAYQGHIGNPLDILFSLLLLAPLYGTVAVLIREVARRTGRGWPTILTLSAAFGLVQAGLIDQSLFDHASMESSPYWEGLHTLVPVADVDVAQFLTWVGGHMIWTFAAPIAVVEACAPRLADRPWLGRKGLVGMALLYLAAAVLFVHQLVIVPGFRAEPARLVGTAVVVIALMVAAFVFPRRSAAPAQGRRAPHPGVVAAVAFSLLVLHEVLRDPGPDSPWPWPMVTLSVLVLALLGWMLLRWSGRPGWTHRHVLAAAGSALVITALTAFLVPPLEDPPDYVGKYISNTVVLILLLALLAWGWHQSARARLSGPRFQGELGDGAEVGAAGTIAGLL